MRVSTLRAFSIFFISFAATAGLALAAPPGVKKPAQTFGISGAAFPAPGILIAGQPTGEQIQLLAEEGNYHTVIDLREPGESRGFDEPEAVREGGMVYLNVPVAPAGLDQAAIDRFLAAMRHAQRPLLVHCGGATDGRAAALLYAWLVLDRKEPAPRALATARAAGLSSPELAGKVQKLVAERQRSAP
jgi:protein tyrosine phosphatase (PTP) superfamily phosphohydrolase (DUF442 family)